ncbi:MAG: carboxymuconolactone decarboxylase family protein [Steroidobacteraceae bacterium]
MTRMPWSEFETLAPDVVAGQRAVGKAVASAGIEPGLIELTKIRASQLNGCAYCLQLHLNLARQLKVSTAQLDQVATWREASVFSARERAALAWTEALTRMAQAPVEDALYAGLQAQFSAPQIAALTASVGLINAWNRICGALQFLPPAATPSGT